MINFRYQKKTKETGKGIVFMYNENENNDLGRMTPEEHKEEPVTTNFTMRDPDPEETKHESGYEKKDSQPEYTRQEDRSAYGQQMYQENQNQGMNQSQGMNQGQSMNQGMNSNQTQNQQPYRTAQPMGQNQYQGGQNVYQGSQNGQSQNAYRSAYGYQQGSPNQQPYGGTPVSENGTGICSGRTKAAEEEIRLC